MMARAAATAAGEAGQTGRHPAHSAGSDHPDKLSERRFGRHRDDPRHGRAGSSLGRARQSLGMSGVVCSAQEIEIVRKEVGPDFLIVTPGDPIRGRGRSGSKRVMTPALAVAKGSDYLVIGRPITQAASPAEAFARIVEELEGNYKPE
ncbi:MAG: orotidine 5'-phosphate decarboxylase [Anaerotruncus sp.]|nr:orotidine 5'-phosphate decarboxylase [Anaerotruncus sp.]